MTNDDVSTLTYEQALALLDEIIVRLEKGSVDLDEAIASYERGATLVQRCADLLDRTEARVLQLVVGPGGRDQERPFAAEQATTGAQSAGEREPGGRGDGGESVAENARGGRAPETRPRARSVAPRAGGAGAELFPGLNRPGDPATTGAPPFDIDPDDIPF